MENMDVEIMDEELVEAWGEEQSCHTINKREITNKIYY